ncbi:hypothetical protein [Paraburkholderia sacchari]|uniref:hypothetical protein n=1 Tax=Paraburkholderia sacchari TaxID=159450 RepID=UPI000541D425|nr:hypothetical protein [Paraburkholderia sacchari]NLP64212.1 hypothetical protein [Paraburkholderia sacchari]
MQTIVIPFPGAGQQPRIARKPTNETERIALLMATVSSLRYLVDRAQPYLAQIPHPDTPEEATLEDCAHHALDLASDCVAEFGHPKDILGVDTHFEALERIYAIPVFAIGE